MNPATATLTYLAIIALIPALAYRYYTRRQWPNVIGFGLAFIAANFVAGILVTWMFPANAIIPVLPTDYAARVLLGAGIAYAIYYLLLTQIAAFKAERLVWKIFTASYLFTVLTKMFLFLYVTAALDAGLTQSLMQLGGV